MNEPPHGGADSAALIEHAWELSYLDPLRAGALGREVAQRDDAWAGWGWLHVALSQVRHADARLAGEAVERASARFRADGVPRGLALADEVRAIALRRGGDLSGSARLQAEIDARTGIAYTEHDRFIAHNSRAITRKTLGEVETALRHFYAAVAAARATGWIGARLTALCNLGGYHHDLYNLDDARSLSEEALREARQAGAKPAIATSAANLVLIHYASGDGPGARRAAQLLIDIADEFVPGTLERLALMLALGHVAVGEYGDAQRYLDRGVVNMIADGDGGMLWAWLQARCWLADGRAADARELALRTLREGTGTDVRDLPFDLMELHRVAADACERVGDYAGALACVKQANMLYEQLVGRSARARYAALRARHEMAEAERERDSALRLQRQAEEDRRRLAELNAALEAKIAETEMLHAQLREQALRDPLTGLHNRRHLFESAPPLLARAARAGQPLSVVLLDLDHFKRLNDTHGHQAGDAVLRHFGELLRRSLRRGDVICRHGGEEFVALMPDIGEDGAAALLERLLAAFQTEPLQLADGTALACSFSAGIAVHPKHGETLEQLLLRADRALYAAKHGGRARIARQPLAAA